MALKESYAPGETITASFTDSAAVSMSATLTDGSKSSSGIALDKSGSVFSLSFADPGFSGRVRYEILATDSDGSVRSVASGSLFFRVLISPNRAIVTAIDKAIQTWGTNPNKSIVCGELSITYKSLDELLSIRSHYASLADADENGVSSSGGCRSIFTEFV